MTGVMTTNLIQRQIAEMQFGFTGMNVRLWLCHVMCFMMTLGWYAPSHLWTNTNTDMHLHHCGRQKMSCPPLSHSLASITQSLVSESHWTTTNAMFNRPLQRSPRLYCGTSVWVQPALEWLCLGSDVEGVTAAGPRWRPPVSWWRTLFHHLRLEQCGDSKSLADYHLFFK